MDEEGNTVEKENNIRPDVNGKGLIGSNNYHWNMSYINNVIAKTVLLNGVDLQTTLNEKQTKLISGEGISIAEDGTISVNFENAEEGAY